MCRSGIKRRGGSPMESGCGAGKVAADGGESRPLLRSLGSCALTARASSATEQIAVSGSPPSALPLSRVFRRVNRRWQRNDLAEVRKRGARMRKGHGVDEMFLKARLDRGFDLFDAADQLLDLTPGLSIEKGDPRPGAGGIAGGGDLVEITVGDRDRAPSRI